MALDPITRYCFGEGEKVRLLLTYFFGVVTSMDSTLKEKNHSSGVFLFFLFQEFLLILRERGQAGAVRLPRQSDSCEF